MALEGISLKTISGQMRIVEVILASFVIIFAIFFVNIMAITPTSPKYEVTELEKMGYNVLYDLDKQGLLATFVYAENWSDLQAALRVLLPLEVHFNLTIYYINGTVANASPIFYGSLDTFYTSKNVASITYGLCGYSTTSKAVYDPRILVLQLARG
ncbi:MAG: hypothetical protein QXH03_00805 [Candidatus Bathyarchaeia archaeon]